MKIELEGLEELSQALRQKSSIRWDGVLTKNLTEMHNRVKMEGVTPFGNYDDGRQGGQLRESVSVSLPSGNGDSGEMGYTKAYAPHVEYGHRQQVGRYVPAIGKRLVKSYVKGQYFLKKNVDAQREIFKDDLLKELKR